MTGHDNCRVCFEMQECTWILHINKSNTQTAFCCCYTRETLVRRHTQNHYTSHEARNKRAIRPDHPCFRCNQLIVYATEIDAGLENRVHTLAVLFLDNFLKTKMEIYCFTNLKIF